MLEVTSRGHPVQPSLIAPLEAKWSPVLINKFLTTAFNFNSCSETCITSRDLEDVKMDEGLEDPCAQVCMQCGFLQ